MQCAPPAADSFAVLRAVEVMVRSERRIPDKGGKETWKRMDPVLARLYGCHNYCTNSGAPRCNYKWRGLFEYSRYILRLLFKIGRYTRLESVTLFYVNGIRLELIKIAYLFNESQVEKRKDGELS